MPFPTRSRASGDWADDDELRDGRPDRLHRRHRSQATSADSLSRHLVTGLAAVIGFFVLVYLLMQLAQLGKQTPPTPTVVPSAATQVQPGPVGGQPVAVPPPPGQGPLRVTSRVLEPSYTVAPGDTLGTIAARFGTTVEAIVSINNVTDRNLLSVGQKLVIPNQP